MANPNFHLAEVLVGGKFERYLAVAIKAAKAIDEACDGKEEETDTNS